jgi:antitoxin MazE
MLIQIVPIGDGRGIQIPESLLRKYAISDTVELQLTPDGILLRPLAEPRQGWDQAFARMAEAGDDILLIDDVFQDEECWT